MSTRSIFSSARAYWLSPLLGGALLAFAQPLTGCGGNCSDDGFGQDLESCNAASASESNSDSDASAGPDSNASDSSASDSNASNSMTDSGGTDSGSDSNATDSMTDSMTDSATEGVSQSDTDSTAGGGCDNGVQDGDETDVDCGGACGNTCLDGQLCMINGDCLSDLCDGGACQADPACSNGEQDDGETDVDCGGSCGPTCLDGQGCFSDDDCVSQYCNPDSDTCEQPACDDGIQNGDETDVDCGGSCGPTCQVGELCTIGDDCVTMLCEGGTCGAPGSCNNGMQDNDETDVDCGGSCGPTCQNDQDCNVDEDCVSLHCAQMSDTCQAPACDDGVQNGDETDVDCGGSCGNTCENGDHCLVDGDCVSNGCSPDEECIPPECVIQDGENDCKGCIKTSCCDAVVDCLEDVDCTCWLNCIQHNNDFDPCKVECGINGNPGPITACANSKCNTIDACAKP
ncbi:MAG: hypothetical protein H6713_26105 [Myxococcales bacterium]|nr:hypothetical protein [Myxococcales bacterium]